MKLIRAVIFSSLIFSALILIQATSFSADKIQWAKTRDKAGTTNVRASTSLKSKVVTRIRVDELFKVIARPPGEWYKVQTNSKLKGFVHRDRVLLVEDSPSSAIPLGATAKKDTTFIDSAATLADVFKKERALLKKFAAEKSHSAELTVELDTYTDAHFEPALELFVTYICKNKDSLLVDSLFDTVLADTVATTEAPPNALAKSLLCQDELILHSIKKLPKDRKDAIIDRIVLGLQNFFDIPEDQDPDLLPKDYSRLKEKLDSLREKRS